LEQRKVGVGRALGCVEIEAPREDRQPREQHLLLFAEECIAPFDGRAKRPLSFGQIARASGEQVEVMLEPVEHLPRRQHLNAHSGELERKWEPVEAAGDRGDVLVRLE
jgi:hypothetical protein